VALNPATLVSDIVDPPEYGAASVVLIALLLSYWTLRHDTRVRERRSVGERQSDWWPLKLPPPPTSPTTLCQFRMNPPRPPAP
jgi:hypothetical protein